VTVTLESQDITENALPRMAVEVLDDLGGAALGLGEFSVHFPDKICFSFDRTEQGFTERFEKVLEPVAVGMRVTGTGEMNREGCLEMARRAFREDCSHMVKSFWTNYFEDSYAVEWRHDMLGMDAGEVAGYIQDQDARSRMGTLKEVYRLHEDRDGSEESNSISAQRSLLEGHIRELMLGQEYVVLEFRDDGYSGTDFNRPGVQALISAARAWWP